MRVGTGVREAEGQVGLSCEDLIVGAVVEISITSGVTILGWYVMSGKGDETLWGGGKETWAKPPLQAAVLLSNVNNRSPGSQGGGLWMARTAAAEFVSRAAVIIAFFSSTV